MKPAHAALSIAALRPGRVDEPEGHPSWVFPRAACASVAGIGMGRRLLPTGGSAVRVLEVRPVEYFAHVADTNEVVAETLVLAPLAGEVPEQVRWLDGKW